MAFFSRPCCPCDHGQTQAHRHAPIATMSADQQQHGHSHRQHGSRLGGAGGSRRRCKCGAPGLCRRSPRRGRSPVGWGLDTPGARTQVAPSTAAARAVAAHAARECEVVRRRTQLPQQQKNGTRTRVQRRQHPRRRQQHELLWRLQQRGRLMHLPPPMMIWSLSATTTRTATEGTAPRRARRTRASRAPRRAHSRARAVARAAATGHRRKSLLR